MRFIAINWFYYDYSRIFTKNNRIGILGPAGARDGQCLPTSCSTAFRTYSVLSAVFPAMTGPGP